MSSTPQQPTDESVEPQQARSGIPAWLIALMVIMALFLVYVAYAQNRTRQELVAQLTQANEKLSALTTRANSLEDQYANLKAQFDVTSEKLGMTQEELSRARSLARQIKEEQQRTAAQLGTKLEQQQVQLGSLSGEVGTVKGDVAQTRQALEETRSTLQHTIGDLGVQSGLIARNINELEELKRRGERDYFDFNVKKSNQFTRVGSVSLRLNKTDIKRQRFTVTLLDSDKRIEKKDKTLLEPVQFYMQGTRHLLEIVVFQIDKDHIVGYLSVPKEVAAAHR